MKQLKALIICYDYPPINTVSANRVESWAKQLAKHHVQPTIITRKWNIDITDSSNYYANDSGEYVIDESETHSVTRIPFKMTFVEKMTNFLTRQNWIFLRKIVTFCTLFLKWLPGLSLEKSFYKDQLPKIVDIAKYDIILASGEPFILFKYAHELSKKYGVSWIADYRDGFTTNFTKNNKGINKIVNAYESFFEGKYFRSVKKFVTVSDIIAADLQRKFGTKPYAKVENGINLKAFNSVVVTPNPIFTICYTGTVYLKQDAPSFLAAFEEFIARHKKENFELLFVGIDYFANSHTELINAFQQQHTAHVKILPRLDKLMAIEVQKKASVLLKFSSAAMVKGFYGAKLYEYVACNKPIINVVRESSHAKTDFFEASGIQHFCCGKEEILALLERLYQQFRKKELRDDYLSEEEIYSISREHQTKILAEALKECSISS